MGVITRGTQRLRERQKDERRDHSTYTGGQTNCRHPEWTKPLTPTPDLTLTLTLTSQIVVSNTGEVDPKTITICKRPDGSDWCLGSGTYGKVRSAHQGLSPVSWLS